MKTKATLLEEVLERLEACEQFKKDAERNYLMLQKSDLDIDGTTLLLATLSITNLLELIEAYTTIVKVGLKLATINEKQSKKISKTKKVCEEYILDEGSLFAYTIKSLKGKVEPKDYLDEIREKTGYNAFVKYKLA